MQEKQSKFHYAWLILIAAICIQGGIIGIMVNCTGVIFSAIIEDLGFRSGDLSIYYTIRAFLQAAACGVTTKLFLNKNPKLVMTGLATLGLAGYVGMYFYTDLWQWYLSGVLVGICMSCVLVVIPVVLNNWFAVKNGMVIGIAMAASGLAGAVFSPVLSSLIITMGWRKTAVFNGAVAFLLIAVPSLLLLVRTPEEMGDKEIIKMMFIDEPEILDAAIEKIPQEFFDRYTIVKSTPFYLEFMNKKASKGNAIKHLAEKMGLTPDQTMAIGDAENDRAMLEAVGNPVVMENGTPELKEIAKYITKSNEESGVAHALREWVLK